MGSRRSGSVYPYTVQRGTRGLCTGICIEGSGWSQVSGSFFGEGTRSNCTRFGSSLCDLGGASRMQRTKCPVDSEFAEKGPYAQSPWSGYVVIECGCTASGCVVDDVESVWEW